MGVALLGGCSYPQETMSIPEDAGFQRKSPTSCCNKSNNPCQHKSSFKRPPLRHAAKEFPNTSIYFSAALSKFKKTLLEMINHMNSKIFEFSSFHHQLSLI